MAPYITRKHDQPQTNGEDGLSCNKKLCPANADFDNKCDEVINQTPKLTFPNGRFIFRSCTCISSRASLTDVWQDSTNCVQFLSLTVCISDFTRLI